MAIYSDLKKTCKKCYSCVRGCPVNAIRFEEDQAELMEDECVQCGFCVNVCSQNNKVMKSDIKSIEKSLKNRHVSTIALLAPSFVASFMDHPNLVVGALKRLGFDKVYEVAQGASMVAREYAKLYREPIDKPVLTSPCPVIVNMVEKHYPSLIDHLAPIISPLVAVADHIRKNERVSNHIVFIGPCIAKKTETERVYAEGSVDFVLLFNELKKLFEEHNINVTKMNRAAFDHFYEECRGQVFPVAGGLLKAAEIETDILNNKITVVEGKKEVIETFRAIEQGKLEPMLIDILYCKGCIDGPDFHNDENSLQYRKSRVIEFAKHSLEKRGSEIDEPTIKNRVEITKNSHYEVRQKHRPKPDDQQVQDILAKSHKYTREDELNCGACGYETCREKAVAVYQGIAEFQMCLPYLLSEKENEVYFYKKRVENFIESYKEIDERIIGNSDSAKAIKSFIVNASKTNSTVLLLGESGTGKTYIANNIHLCGERRNEAFVNINCSAIPKELIEAELFGYEEGAFTGAKKGGNPGKFEQANGGTIFLDEIADMSPQMQAKLLQVIQDKEIQRVGGQKNIPLDLKIITATNKSLEEEIINGGFWEDLFHRINVLTFTVPSLRERPDDIPLLVEHMIKKLANNHMLPQKSISKDAMQVLCEYRWPGNVRELENLLERLMNLVDGNVIKDNHMPFHLWKNENIIKQQDSVPPLDDLLEKVEKETIVNALQKTNNNRTKAAELLKVSRSNFYEKLRKYNID